MAPLTAMPPRRFAGWPRSLCNRWEPVGYGGLCCTRFHATAGCHGSVSRAGHGEIGRVRELLTLRSVSSSIPLRLANRLQHGSQSRGTLGGSQPGHPAPLVVANRGTRHPWWWPTRAPGTRFHATASPHVARRYRAPLALFAAPLYPVESDLPKIQGLGCVAGLGSRGVCMASRAASSIWQGAP